MTKKLEEALNSVETTYRELVDIATSMLAKYFDPINELVEKISKNVNTLSIDQIRDYILELQLKAFEICEIKEKSALKAEVAEALEKEKFAHEFTIAEGSAAVKDKLASTAVAADVLSEAIYNLIANLLKTKIDSVHRLVDCLKSILMSRMQETKFMNLGTSSEVPNTDGRIFEPTKGE